jgi:hypothetical protein
MVIKATEAEAYMLRAERVRDAFERLPRGAQSECSHDLRVSASTLSQVVRGVLVDPAKLGAIEAWLDQRTSGREAVPA